MPFVNVTPTYKTVETSVQHQIGIRFTCPVCGKDSEWIDRQITATAESTGMEETAEKLAYQKAEADLDEMLKHMDAENMLQMLGEPIKCPHCGAIQLPGRADETVSKAGCVTFFIPGLAAVILYALFLFTNWFEKSTLSVGLVTAAALLIGIGLFIGYKLDMKRRNKLAAENPQAELKYLGAVHNERIEVDFRGRGPAGIVVMEPAPEENDEEDDEEEDDE